MAINDIYKDIAGRLGGNIYIGVVGPVRTGKSTFVAKIMENLVLKNIEKSKKTVAIDEMPQSGSGKTVTTTEPKFIPADGVNVTLGDATAKVRIVDCVGYMVDGALGFTEDGEKRMVKTPWQNKPVPFEQAAEYGTDKVITEHSTIGVVVTTDGSFTEIPREKYVEAEDKVIEKLKSLDKPFVVVFNTTEPGSKKTAATCAEIEKKHGVNVVAADVMKLDTEKISGILKEVLYEFPITKLSVALPDFIEELPKSSKIVKDIVDKLKEGGKTLTNMRSLSAVKDAFAEIPGLTVDETRLDTASGSVKITLAAGDELFYRVIRDETEENIEDRASLINFLRKIYRSGKTFDKIKSGFEQAVEEGYGVVAPQVDEITTDKPRLVKKAGGSYGVKIRAEGKTTHIVNTTVGVDVDVVTGSKTQCEDFLGMLGENDDYLKTEVFGRPLYALIGGEMNAKCSSVGGNLKGRVKRILTKAVNEGKNNLICILI